MPLIEYDPAAALTFAVLHETAAGWGRQLQEQYVLGPPSPPPASGGEDTEHLSTGRVRLWYDHNARLPQDEIPAPGRPCTNTRTVAPPPRVSRGPGPKAPACSSQTADQPGHDPTTSDTPSAKSAMGQH